MAPAPVDRSVSACLLSLPSDLLEECSLKRAVLCFSEQTRKASGAQDAGGHVMFGQRAHDLWHPPGLPDHLHNRTSGSEK